MFFKKIDFLSPKLTLYYNSQKSHSSVIGGLLTLIAYITIFVFTVYFSLDIILKKNPTAYLYNRVVEDAGTFTFDSSSMFHYIYFEFNHNLYNYTKYFQVLGFKNVYTTVYNADGVRENYDHWIYERCKDDMLNLNNKKNEKYNNIIKGILNYTEFYVSYCISKFYNSTTKKIISYKDSDFKFPTVEHGMSNGKGTYYGTYLQKCQNSSLNNYSCASQEDIDKIFNTYESPIGFVIINQEIDVKNYEEPFIHSLYKVTNSLVNDQFTANHLNFQPYNLVSNEGIFFEKKKGENSFFYEQTEKMTHDTDTGIISSFYIWMQNKASIYERSYKHIQEVLASIGGASRVIITFCSCINYIFSKFTTYRDINNVMNLYINLKGVSKSILILVILIIDSLIFIYLYIFLYF